MKTGTEYTQAFQTAVLLALPTRIEMETEIDSDSSTREKLEALLKEWVNQILQNPGDGDQNLGDGVKKKT
jgi:hypothetical protein